MYNIMWIGYVAYIVNNEMLYSILVQKILLYIKCTKYGHG